MKCIREDKLLELRSAVICFPTLSTLEFIYNFMENFLCGENDMVTCGHIAYDKSFKRYHNWVIRGIFQVCYDKIPYANP